MSGQKRNWGKIGWGNYVRVWQSDSHGFHQACGKKNQLEKSSNYDK